MILATFNYQDARSLLDTLVRTASKGQKIYLVSPTFGETRDLIADFCSLYDCVVRNDVDRINVDIDGVSITGFSKNKPLSPYSYTHLVLVNPEKLVDFMTPIKQES